MAAIEDPTAGADPNAEKNTKRGMRAVVVSDGELFSDAIVSRTLARVLVVDAIKWLGGEEEFAGATKSEKDVRIVHSKGEDKLWFNVNIFGAPLLMLGLGLIVAMFRRRSRRQS